MIKNLWFALFFVLILLAACQGQSGTLPALAELPTETMLDQASPVVTESPAAISAVVTKTDTPVPAFTAVPTASATNTVLASPAANQIASPALAATVSHTPTLTATPTRCPMSNTSFAYTDRWRINIAYTTSLANLFTDSDLPLIAMTIYDHAWEEGYCVEADEWVALFHDCDTLVVALRAEGFTINDRARRADYVEAVLAVVKQFDACNPDQIRITFHSLSTNIYWEVDHFTIQNAYDAGERGVTLYEHGVETVNYNLT